MSVLEKFYIYEETYVSNNNFQKYLRYISSA